ncbi:MAG: hypothetical protein Q4A42_07290 [Tissierellia bacterium]|nr:hypothetical protein [Tissierellia bacterium]
MSKSLLTVTRKMLTPVSDERDPLIYREGEIVHSIPTIYGNDRRIEVYVYKDSFEWRIIEFVKNELGVDKKIVRYDSLEALYGISEVALLDALLFCHLEDL